MTQDRDQDYLRELRPLIAAARALVRQCDQAPLGWLRALEQPLPQTLGDGNDPLLARVRELADFDLHRALAERLEAAAPTDQPPPPQPKRLQATFVPKPPGPPAPANGKPPRGARPVSPLQHSPAKASDPNHGQRTVAKVAEGPAAAAQGAAKAAPRTKVAPVGTQSKGQVSQPGQNPAQDSRPRPVAESLAERRRAYARNRVDGLNKPPSAKPDGAPFTKGKKGGKGGKGTVGLAPVPPLAQAPAASKAKPHPIPPSKHRSAAEPAAVKKAQQTEQPTHSAAAPVGSKPPKPRPTPIVQPERRNDGEPATGQENQRGAPGTAQGSELRERAVERPADRHAAPSHPPRPDLARQLAEAAYLHGVDLT